MAAVLRCGNLDLNDPELVRRLVQALSQILTDPGAWHRLEVRKYYYFQTLDGHLSTGRGWYVICDGMEMPLYVGQAENLDNRLNSENGSRDNFANPQRTNDNARNFIKALRTMGYIATLRVAVVCEPDLLRRIDFAEPLDNRDRANIEKILGLFRHAVLTSRAP
jgi:hypothetical protein